MSRIFLAKTKAELERCFPVMKELRPHLDFAAFLEIYASAHKADGYEIAAIEREGKILAVMGYRILWDYVRGKHLYIDDLVATATARSQGLGAELLQFAEKVAAENACPSLRLCTGTENEKGMKFYEREGWTKRSFAYVKRLSQNHP